MLTLEQAAFSSCARVSKGASSCVSDHQTKMAPGFPSSVTPSRVSAWGARWSGKHILKCTRKKRNMHWGVLRRCRLIWNSVLKSAKFPELFRFISLQEPVAEATGLVPGGGLGSAEEEVEPSIKEEKGGKRSYG